jgi:hypothetical protein
MPAEARDHVTMSAGLIRGEFKHTAKLLWRRY